MADRLSRIKEQSKEIWMVKLADRITNLQPPPGHWNAEKIDSYREEGRMILETLTEVRKYLAERMSQQISKYAV